MVGIKLQDVGWLTLRSFAHCGDDMAAETPLNFLKYVSYHSNGISTNFTSVLFKFYFPAC